MAQKRAEGRVDSGEGNRRGPSVIHVHIFVVAPNPDRKPGRGRDQACLILTSRSALPPSRRPSASQSRTGCR